MIRTAVIMAAGMGTRFGKYTELVPKGFVEVNGIPMVIQSIETLISCGIERVIIGTGYHKEAYEALCADYPEVICCHSPRYAETNCLYTLWNCRELIGDEDFLMLDSDLIYEPKAITSLIECKYPSAILTTPVKKFQDSIRIKSSSLKNYTQQKNAELNNIKNNLSNNNEFYKNLNRTIKKVAENEGLSMVINLQQSNAILWYSPAVDITDKVIESLEQQ